MKRIVSILEANAADGKHQVAKDPAPSASAPQLAVPARYIQCMAPRGWKVVDPDAAAPAKP